MKEVDKTSFDPCDMSTVPDEFKRYYSSDTAASEYADNQDPRDIIIPRIVLLQAMSPTVQDGIHKPGQVVLNSDDSCVFIKDPAKDTFLFIVCRRWKQRALYGPDRGKPPLCRSHDFLHGVGIPGGRCCDANMNAICEKAIFGQGKRAECSQFYQFFGLAYDGNIYREALLSCWSTKIPFARALITEVARRGKDAPFTRVYKIGVENLQNERGRYYIYKLVKFEDTNQYAAMVTKPEVLRQAASVAEGAKHYRSITTSIDVSAGVDEDSSFDFGAN